MNDYTRHAHRRTIWAELQRLLIQKFIAKGSDPPKEILTCEEAFFADKEVSQEALMEVMEELQRKEADERIQMTQYEFRRRDGQSIAAKDAESGGAEESPAQQRKSSGSPPPPKA